MDKTNWKKAFGLGCLIEIAIFCVMMTVLTTEQGAALLLYMVPMAIPAAFIRHFLFTKKAPSLLQALVGPAGTLACIALAVAFPIGTDGDKDESDDGAVKTEKAENAAAERQVAPAEKRVSSAPDAKENVDDVLAELDGLVGLEGVKSEVRRLVNLVKINEARRKQGMKVILASASFKPITTAIVKELGFDGNVSTIMEEKNGHYTGKVLGVPCQGREKLRLLIQLCNDRYGEGGWQLQNAYSDHYSDLPMLEMAENPIIVDPDGMLKRIAKERSWPIVDWDK